MESMPNATKKRKHGCLKAFVIVLSVFAAIKGCSAYQSRPSALYQKWLGTPVPEDVSELRGAYHFQLTESIAWLRFKAPPERIAKIVRDNGLTLVVPDPHWSVKSDSRLYTMGTKSERGIWFDMIKNPPADQEIYWVSNLTDDDSFLSGWALYYSPSTQEAYFTLHTI